MRLAQEYASVLRTLPKEASSAEKFVALLSRRGHLKLLPTILSAAARMEARDAKVATDTLVVAHQKDAEGAKAEAVSFGAVNPKVHVDHGVVGGWRFVGKSTLVDRTYKRMLLDLYRKMTA